MMKRWITLLLVFILVVSLLPVEAKAAMSGTCGDNLTWTLDDNGTLTISGTGKMDDYSRYAEGAHAPWRDYIELIRSIVLNPGITEIGVSSFISCLYVQSIEIPDSVTHIHDAAFENCFNLTTIRLSDNLVSLGEIVFFNCPIKTLTIPDSLTDVHEDAFVGIDFSARILVGENNTALATDSTGVLYNKSFTRLIHAPADAIGAEYTIPSTVTSIGAEAFRDCDNLWRITISEGITEIGFWAFGDCDNLLSISLPETLTDIGYGAFSHCASLRGITIPGSVTTMGKWVFKDCTALESVLLSDGLTRIEICMFQGCTALRNIVIPASIYYIGSDAFFDCRNLENIYFRGTQEQWDSIYISSDNVQLTNGTVQFVLPDDERPGSPPDRWSFENSFDVFGPDEEGYYITMNDYKRLISNLSYTDLLAVCYADDAHTIYRYNVDGNIKSAQTSPWGGSCFGMSSWVCLVNNGVLRPSDIDGKTQHLRNFTLTPAVESAINYYYFQQAMGKMLAYKREFAALAQVAQMEHLESLGKIANATGKVFRIGYGWYKYFHSDGTVDTKAEDSSTNHSVVGYGWEAIEPITFVVHGITFTFDQRILIYDCAHTSDPENYHLYYNDNGIWYIPGGNIISTNSQTADTWYNNAILTNATNETHLLNLVDYNTGIVNPVESVITLSTPSDMSYTVSMDGTVAEISGFTVTSDAADHGIYVFPMENTTITGETVPSAKITVLPEADSYMVTSEQDTMSFSLHRNDILTTAVMDSPGSIIFSENGSVSFDAEQSASYSLNLAADTGTAGLSWNQVTISGENACGASAEITDSGVVISSDNLAQLRVSAETRETEIALNAVSGQSSVLITENSGKLVVCEDTDNDGTYETTIAESLPFTDVSVDAFYHDAVCWAVRNGITSGMTATTFAPNNQCTRGQVVTFLWRAAGKPEPTVTSHPFTDVSEGAYYYKAMLWAVENGITSGMTATTFAPNAVCSRGQVVTFLYRAKGKPDITSTTHPFTDVSEKGFYYRAMLWAVENKITSGMSATTFAPDNACTRGQVVTFLYRTYN